MRQWNKTSEQGKYRICSEYFTGAGERRGRTLSRVVRTLNMPGKGAYTLSFGQGCAIEDFCAMKCYNQKCC